jgi:restriction endonuclease S subunit
MQTEKLKNIANVSLGYSFRGSIKEKKDGNMLVVQAKNAKDSLYIDSEDELIKIDHPIYEDRLVLLDDVILTSRGYFHAAVSKIDSNMIASSSVYILRSKDTNIILPEYLALYLNSPQGQTSIIRNQTGAMVKVILKSDLEGLKIPIPNIKRQKTVIQLFKTMDNMQNILSKKQTLLDQTFNGLLSQITH